MESTLQLIVAQNWALIGLLLLLVAMSAFCGYHNLKNMRRSEEMRESSVSELWDKGDFDTVEKVAKEILAQHPNQVDALYFLGKVLASRGENEKAISLWEKVQRNEPMLSKNMEDLIHSARQRDAT